MSELPSVASEKVCRVCGRQIEWRAKWKDCWDEVKLCSAQCRKQGLRPLDTLLEQAILELLSQRKRGATICPSEAARSVRPEHWRPLMERTRSAARRLVHRGEVLIYQQGRTVNPSTAKGPIRIGSTRDGRRVI